MILFVCFPVMIPRQNITMVRLQNWPRSPGSILCSHRAPIDVRGDCSDMLEIQRMGTDSINRVCWRTETDMLWQPSGSRVSVFGHISALEKWQWVCFYNIMFPHWWYCLDLIKASTRSSAVLYRDTRDEVGYRLKTAPSLVHLSFPGEDKAV